MKFCKDCAHHALLYGGGIAFCKKTIKEDMVTGSSDYFTCLEARTDETKCGKAASWFELPEQPPSAA